MLQIPNYNSNCSPKVNLFDRTTKNCENDVCYFVQDSMQRRGSSLFVRLWPHVMLRNKLCCFDILFHSFFLSLLTLRPFALFRQNYFSAFAPYQQIFKYFIKIRHLINNSFSKLIRYLGLDSS